VTRRISTTSGDANVSVEADLLPQQCGFRPGLDAKMALRRVYWRVTQHGRREVVDADFRDYFTSIPHTPLMRSLSRRIADGRMLHVINGWLTAPVVEAIATGVRFRPRKRDGRSGEPRRAE
jgi:RNA-directed DNA polymerase